MNSQSHRPEQLYKLNADLELVRGNMTVLNEMLSELVPGKEDGSDVQLLTVTSFLRLSINIY